MPVLLSVRPPATSATAFAMIVAEAAVDRFTPAIRLHECALFELSELANRGDLTLDTTNWHFVPSANGGYALKGLRDVLLVLSEESWLRRDAASSSYLVSAEFTDWGTRELARLSLAERLRVSYVAARWKARASVSSKNLS